MRCKPNSIILFSIFLLTLSFAVRAQMNTCLLNSESINKETGKFSDNNGLTPLLQFSFNGENKETIKWFTDTQTGTRIWVGANVYGGLIGGTRKHIEVAIAFGDIGREFRELFQYADSAIAETLYDEKFKFVSVSKIIETKDKIYKFRFTCSKTK